jgi:hypothetical protein
MFCPVVPSPTNISVVFARVTMAKKWSESMERGSIGERKTLTRCPFTLVEVERAMDSEPLVSF